MLVVIESLGYLEYVILGIDFHFSQAEVCEKYTIVNIDLIFFKNGNIIFYLVLMKVDNSGSTIMKKNFYVKNFFE